MTSRIPAWAAAGILAFAVTSAAQSPGTAPAPTSTHKEAARSAEESLQQRVDAYYQNVRKNQKTAAYELVAPESRNDFFNMDYNTLVGFRITGVHLSKDGSTATVDLIRSMRVPTFQQILDMPAKDTWKLVDGKWDIVLPSAKDKNTPFGKMHFGQAPASSAQVEQQMKQSSKDIDPAEYLYALKKAMKAAPPPAKTQGKNPPSPKAKKPAASSPENQKPNPSSPHE